MRTIALTACLFWIVFTHTAVGDIASQHRTQETNEFTFEPVTVKIDRFRGWLAGNDNDRPINTSESVRRAIQDMIQTFGDRYPNGSKYLEELAAFEKRFAEKEVDADRLKMLRNDFAAFQRRVLLANPLLDFDKILVVRGSLLAAPNNNFVTLEKVAKEGFDNELGVLSNLRGEPQFIPFYRPANGRPISDPELHWDGDRVMFSSISEETKHWGIFEVRTDGTGLKTLTPTDQPDIDFFDSCYVPDGTLITASTASRQGLPCMNGDAAMVNLYKIDPETKKVRQLTFEQDSDWHPTMMRNGRVMYMRWEYTDLMHYYSRILFHMNPDGTNQSELYGSGSLFPTTLKHAREIPDSSEIVVILSGHHGRGDTGRLAIIDPSVARKYPFQYRPTSKEWGPEGTQFDIHPEVLPASQTGFIQELPGFGREVVGNVLDNQADGLTYNFIFPYPLSENYFLVNCQIAGDPNTYGLYLIDRFDNLTLIKKIDNQGLFYPTPLVKQEQPNVIPSRVDLDSDEATVFITDIYNGQGTINVPRGTLKKLRIFSYHFAYNKRGGHDAVGIRSGWDVKRILGEVPIEEDGSVFFTIPSNTPVSLQPLDEEGRAVQIMRSWFLGMPSENISCNGCHESQLQVTPSKSTAASRRAPDAITPFYGPVRSVTFETELYYPVVKRFCIDCHDGTKPDRPSFADAKTAYDNIHPFIRRPGPESDMDVLNPMEYHDAGTSELFQMFEKNHYNVVLDKEARERLYCWADLNTPWLGKWDHPQDSKRRIELEKLYTNSFNDYETEFDQLLTNVRSTPVELIRGRAEYQKPTDTPELTSKIGELRQSHIWSLDTAEAKKRQLAAADGGKVTKDIELASGIVIRFALIPAGTFVMGSLEGYPDEAPRVVVEIKSPFWMSTTEVTNAQYAVFDSKHDTRYIEEYGKDHVVPGHIANHPNQPVARISWNEASQFADWFSQTYRVKADLPTESQWEWAARAGSDTRFYFGTLSTDYSPFANLAGAERLRQNSTFIDGSTIHRRFNFPKEGVFPLRDDRFEDKWFVVDYVAQYAPNAWGLYDMIGNNCEWTKSDYRPYSYLADQDAHDGHKDTVSRNRKVARGGSWNDRPKATGASTRYPYEVWQKVHNVGLRLIINSK